MVQYSKEIVVYKASKMSHRTKKIAHLMMKKTVTTIVTMKGTLKETISKTMKSNDLRRKKKSKMERVTNQMDNSHQTFLILQLSIQ